MDKTKAAAVLKSGVFWAVLFAVAAALCAGYLIYKKTHQQTGRFAVINVKGETLTTLPLGEDTEYTFFTERGVNTVMIKDGKVSVSYSDCKNQICVDTGSISHVGESIICAPHRLTVTVTGETDTDVVIV